MNDEFDFESITAVEFCVSVRTGKSSHGIYLVPTDTSVQNALKQMLSDTRVEVEPEKENWDTYELSEKYASKESLRADLSADAMASVRALHESEGWEINAKALADPKRLDYYFAVFRDRSVRRLTAVRQATQFKGAFKGRFLSIVDDTLQLVPDHLFKLDTLFDFLITAQHVYILHHAGFERVAEIEEFAAAKARRTAAALGRTVKFLDFTGIAEYVGKHKRAARLVAGLHARTDLGSIQRPKFLRAAKDTGVTLEKAGNRLAPAKGSEIGCLEILDDRRYTTALKRGAKSAFIANSRKRV